MSSVSTALMYFVRKNYLKNIVVTADRCSMVNEPFVTRTNPLIVKCILNFTLFYNKYEQRDDDLFKLVPMDIKTIVEGCKSLKHLFVKAIHHFRTQLFSISST